MNSSYLKNDFFKYEEKIDLIWNTLKCPIELKAYLKLNTYNYAITFDCFLIKVIL